MIYNVVLITDLPTAALDSVFSTESSADLPELCIFRYLRLLFNFWILVVEVAVHTELIWYRELTCFSFKMKFQNSALVKKKFEKYEKSKKK